MAISDKDFYASHGISYDIEEMQIEYTKRVIKQAKIEVLTEIQLEIDSLPTYNDVHDIADYIQEKINALKGGEDGKQ